MTSMLHYWFCIGLPFIIVASGCDCIVLPPELENAQPLTGNDDLPPSLDELIREIFLVPNTTTQQTTPVNVAIKTTKV